MKTKRISEKTVASLIIEDFLADLQVDKKTLAARMKIPSSRLSELLSGKQKINFEYASRLSQCLGNSVQYWINVQTTQDMRENKDLIKKIKKEVKPIAA